MILIRRIYTPRSGGGGLTGYLKDLQKATVDAGFPPLAVYRKVLGPHGTMVTVQRWPSLAVYDESRARVRQTEPITVIFSRIYPILASTHVTEVYEEID